MPSKNQVSLPGYFSEAPITKTEAILTHSRRGYRPNSRIQGSGSDREAVLTPPEHAHAVAITCIFAWGGPVVLAYLLVGLLLMCASISPPYFVHTREALLFCVVLGCSVAGGSTLSPLPLFLKT